MTLIQPIGSLLTVDSEGYLVNPCDLNRVTSPWLDVVETVKEAYLNHLGAQAIHSLYLRGSVAKGTAISGISDVDTFCVAFSEETKLEKSWRKEFRQTLSQQFPFQTGAEMWCVSLDAMLNSPSSRGMRAMLKTQSLCLWGEDLAPQLPRCKPGPDMIAHTPKIKKELEKVLQRLPEMPTAADVQIQCQWIMKRLVRTGLERVMEQEQAYTRDLYPCYMTFSKYFPEKSTEMKQALEWAIAPTDSVPAITQLIEGLGFWLTSDPPVNNR